MCHAAQRPLRSSWPELEVKGCRGNASDVDTTHEQKILGGELECKQGKLAHSREDRVVQGCKHETRALWDAHFPFSPIPKFNKTKKNVFFKYRNSVNPVH